MADRNLWLAGTGALGIAAVATTYLVMSQRLSAAEADAALALADEREAHGTRVVELQGQLADCELQRDHARPAADGDRTMDGRVMAVSGTTRVALDATCRVELDWSADPLEGCRALVRCGDEWLYGDVGAGFFDCTVDGQGLAHGEDTHPTSDGGDPRLVVDRLASNLVISDSSPDWSVTIALPADDL